MFERNNNVLIYRYHHNVVQTIIRFFNYRRYVANAYRIVDKELRRTGMTHQSAMVLGQRNYKHLHRICHDANTAHRMIQSFQRTLIVHMLTGKYLDIENITDSKYSFKALDDKLQPVYTQNIETPSMIETTIKIAECVPKYLRYPSR